MPLLRMSLICSFLSGLLFDELPKASYISLTSTPSFTRFSRWLMSRLTMESFLKLKYSMCMLSLAWSMAANMSSNLSCPQVRSTSLLSDVNLIPFSRSWLTIMESARSSTSRCSRICRALWAYVPIEHDDANTSRSRMCLLIFLQYVTFFISCKSNGQQLRGDGSPCRSPIPCGFCEDASSRVWL